MQPAVAGDRIAGPFEPRALLAAAAHLCTGGELDCADRRIAIERRSASTAQAVADLAHVLPAERGADRLVCVVPRLPRTLCGGRSEWPLGDVWGDRQVDLGGAARWRNAFTGEHHEGDALALRDVLRELPVAWLVAEGQGRPGA